MTHPGGTEVPVPIFNRYPSILQLPENTASFIVLDVTQCSLCHVHAHQDSGSVIFLAVGECILLSVCLMIHIPSFGIKGGIGVSIV